MIKQSGVALSEKKQLSHEALEEGSIVSRVPLNILKSIPYP